MKQTIVRVLFVLIALGICTSAEAKRKNCGEFTVMEVKVTSQQGVKFAPMKRVFVSKPLTTSKWTSVGKPADIKNATQEGKAIFNMLNNVAKFPELGNVILRYNYFEVIPAWPNDWHTKNLWVRTSKALNAILCP